MLEADGVSEYRGDYIPLVDAGAGFDEIADANVVGDETFTDRVNLSLGGWSGADLLTGPK
jgi:hypothetical protein